MRLIVKIGTSSVTSEQGHVRRDVIQNLCDEVATIRETAHDVVIVSSGAVGAGLPAIGFEGQRPRDARTLQAASAVGQSRLMAIYNDALAVHGLVAGQILMTPLDFFERSQYLQARGTLERLLELGVVPVINENDAVADDAIRFGDNDRIAALVAHLLGAERLILLTDTAGLFTSDPRNDPDAALVHEISSVHDDLPAGIGGPGSTRGSGGMVSKVAAARMASFSGVTTVIAAADRPGVLADAIRETPGVGTIVRPQPRPLPAKKLWIAFAVEPAGRIMVDAGARSALEREGGSLLAVGVTGVSGDFKRGDSVELLDPDGAPFARGLAAVSALDLATIIGVRTSEQPPGTPGEVIHRDDLVLLR
ncbi:MAG: glutamate 5-kinase [Acidimicrobiales bacterium]